MSLREKPIEVDHEINTIKRFMVFMTIEKSERINTDEIIVMFVNNKEKYY